MSAAACMRSLHATGITDDACRAVTTQRLTMPTPHEDVDFLASFLLPQVPPVVRDMLSQAYKSTCGARRRDGQDPWSQVAGHEAAHAVVAIAVKRRVEGMYLHDDIEGGGFTQLERSSPMCNAVTRQDDRMLRAGVAISCAGFAWEAITGYASDDAWTESSDVLAAWGATSRLFTPLNDAERITVLRAGWDRACTIVAASRAAIDAIARELLDGGYDAERPMSSRLIRRIIRQQASS